jgi:hypothetical protein
MSFKLLDGPMSAAEGESVVRTYHATSLSSGLLGLKAEGYLVVTNLRVVFYAFGSAFAGESILQSEVPLSDVSGITTYKGAHFSLQHLFTALFASLVLSGLIMLAVSTIAGVIATIIRSFEIIPILSFAFAAIFLILSIKTPTDMLRRSVFASCSASGLSGTGLLGGGMFGGTLGSIATLVSVFIGIYTIVCWFQYARRETMAVAIGSKGGSSTPIAISGITGFGLFSGAAIRALSAEPAVDVELLIRELGAMITDLQESGDLAERWRNAKPLTAASYR